MLYLLCHGRFFVAFFLNVHFNKHINPEITMADWDLDADNTQERNPKDTSNRDDQRYIPRWEVHNRIFYQLIGEPEPREAHSRDLSCAGICLKTEQEIIPDQKVKLKIYLSENKSIDVQGHILWTRKISQGYLAGIVFDNIKPENQDVILDYAFEISRNDLINHWFKGWET